MHGQTSSGFSGELFRTMGLPLLDLAFLPVSFVVDFTDGVEPCRLTTHLALTTSNPSTKEPEAFPPSAKLVHGS